jgi:hypothetical protein
LLKLKQEEHAEKGYQFDGKFYIWDHSYYEQKFLQSSLKLDDNLVKEYFPVSVIVPQIIQIYQNLFSIKFVKMKGKNWHSGNPSVMGFCLSGMLSTLFSGQAIFCLEEGCQDEGRLHRILLPRLVPEG